MTLLVDLQNPEAFSELPLEEEFVLWAEAAWLDENDAGVVLRIVGESESRDLNKSFRGKDYSTNVLSFVYEPPAFEFTEDIEPGDVDYLGDLVICAPVVQREASEQGKTAKHHWAHMVIHGLLHLQGFDHISDLEASIMEAREVEILHQLGFPNPYEPL
ncbi:MAG: rRNA maturation RNase YbeY [Proteobacteria bacterium]|nr:MAG: rRNA maturation RNase YbeY [Pseudomonadota bacterium]